jgi:RNA polymerase sigma-70 factor (ECF subfamily)
VCCCNAGEDAAFAEIVARHRSRIHAVALGVLRNQADAEEITQDTFIRAHRALARFRGDSSLSTWLHRIALNLARNRYWYFFRRRRHVTQSLDCPLRAGDPATFADRVADEAPDQIRTLMLEEFSALVAACVRRLEARPREILLLRTVRDLSYEEIAAELGIGLGTVKSRLARARESLRQLLEQTCPDLRNGTDAPISGWFDSLRPPGGIALVGA